MPCEHPTRARLRELTAQGKNIKECAQIMQRCPSALYSMRTRMKDLPYIPVNRQPTYWPKVAELYSQGVSVSEVAERFGISPHTVHGIRYRLGVKPHFRHGNWHSQALIDEIASLLAQKVSYSQIAERMTAKHRTHLTRSSIAGIANRLRRGTYAPGRDRGQTKSARTRFARAEGLGIGTEAHRAKEDSSV